MNMCRGAIRVVRNDEMKLLWDMNIQCDNDIEARRPDITIVSKRENKWILFYLEAVEYTTRSFKKLNNIRI